MYKYILIIAIIMFFLSCDQGPYKKAMDYNKKGTEYYSNGNDSALYYFNKAIQTDSTFQPAIQNKANYHIGKQQYPEALETIDQLLAQSSYVEAYQMKGMLLDILDKSTEARVNYQKALDGIEKRLKKTTKDKQPLNLYNLGFTYFLLGDTVKAAKLIQENKDLAKDLSLGDTILNNLNNKNKIIRMILK